MTTKTKNQVTPATATAASTPSTPHPTPPQVPSLTGVAGSDTPRTKVAIQSSYLGLIAGLIASYQPDDTFLLAEGTFTRDELIAEFQKLVASAEATKASYQAWRADVQSEQAVIASVSPLRTSVKGVLAARWGKSSAKMTTFGFVPAKVGTRTTETMAAAVAKAKATRKARGTKGSVQKLEVTGNVTGVVITPVTSAPALPEATSGLPASPATPHS